MISPGLFMLAHLALIGAGLLALGLNERRGRRSWTAWHGRVRTRRLTTEEVVRRLGRSRNLDSL